MDDAEPTLLLTRPAAQSAEFLALCESALGRKIACVISPVMRIVDVGPIPDVSGHATLVFTSSNAVRRLGEAAVLAGRRAVTVGEATAALARDYGAEAVALGSTAEELCAAADRIVPPALLLRGRHARGDIAARLVRAGVPTDEVIVYDQAGEPLTSEAASLLGGQRRVIAPVFSPRSAELLSASASITAPVIVIAMSPNVAEAWKGPGEIRIAQNPGADAMCACTLEALRGA